MVVSSPEGGARADDVTRLGLRSATPSVSEKVGQGWVVLGRSEPTFT